MEESNADHVPTKYNFAEKFDRPAFKGKLDRPKRDRRNNLKKDKYGNVINKKIDRVKGSIRPEAKKKYNLSPSSTPVDYANIFLPFSTNKFGTKEYTSIQLFT